MDDLVLVSGPLLKAVCEEAIADSHSAEQEFACTEADRAEYRAERDRVEALLAGAVIPRYGREALIRAAQAGFAASREGFNAQCAFDGLEPDDEDIRLALEGDDDPFTLAAIERALELAGLLPPPETKKAPV